MSKKEVARLEVIQLTNERQLTQQQAAERLHLSVRQIKRLAKRYRENGAQGLIPLRVNGIHLRKKRHSLKRSVFPCSS